MKKKKRVAEAKNKQDEEEIDLLKKQIRMSDNRNSNLVSEIKKIQEDYNQLKELVEAIKRLDEETFQEGDQDVQKLIADYKNMKKKLEILSNEV